MEYGTFHKEFFTSVHCQTSAGNRIIVIERCWRAFVFPHVESFDWHKNVAKILFYGERYISRYYHEIIYYIFQNIRFNQANVDRNFFGGEV